MQIYLAGVRGTVPVHTPAFAAYGGATSCVLVKAGDETFILDAGTGLRGDRLSAFAAKPHFTMLISHAHADHLMGFPIFSPLFDPRWSGDVFLRPRNGLDARAQIEALMSPPLWPVRTDALRADVRFRDVPDAFSVGDVTVEALDVRHPGGCTAYKLTRNGVSLVYATDFEAGEDEADFVRFAGDCTLLLLDAQYTPEEYTRTRGFGHSTAERAAALAGECGAKNTIFIHHDPNRTDDILTAWDRAWTEGHPSMHFGREGEEVFL